MTILAVSYVLRHFLAFQHVLEPSIRAIVLLPYCLPYSGDAQLFLPYSLGWHTAGMPCKILLMGGGALRCFHKTQELQFTIPKIGIMACLILAGDLCLWHCFQ